MLDEDEKMRQRIALLEDEHRALDALLVGESRMDQLHIRRLKKRKLWLKDEIARMYDYLYPDNIA